MFQEEVTDYRIIMCAIICLTILEIVALINGINGTMFSIVLFLIGTLSGIVLPTPKILKIKKYYQ